MATTEVTETLSNDSEEEEPKPIEISGVGTESDDYGCCQSCWLLFSWVVSLVLFIVESFVTVWVAYTYATNAMFARFGISLAYLAIPQVILVTLSLVWYYNLDRYHRKKRESDPHNLEYIEYQKKFTVGAVVFHVILLGMIYRYGQLIYLIMIRKTDNLPYLRRDTAYLRLVHSFLVSAPLVILHLYTVFLYLPTCLDPDATQCSIFEFPAVYAALGSSLATLLYSLLTYATSDRLSGKRRQVILPAHLMQILWYLCMLASRMLAIVLFVFTHHYYVFAFVGGHWIVMFLFLLIQRTTFCADVIKESDSDIKVKRRWGLEIPFDFIAATMYIFAFFGFRRGNTRYLAIFFHLLMYAEIATMSALFYIQNMGGNLFVFSLTVLTLTLGLYPVGLLFMLTYYLFFHPKKTKNWYWIGFPKRGSNRDSITTRGFRNRTPSVPERVEISGPTLVAHNGFIPQRMLPDGIPSSPGHENGIATDPADIILQSQRSSEERRDDSNRDVENWVIPRSREGSIGRDLVTSLTMVSPDSTGNATTLPPESLPTLSEVHSQVGPLDIDTDVGSSVLHVTQGSVKGDTIIDTPLFGNTPDPVQQMKVKSHDEPASGTLRSLTDTVDTGIDLGADASLTDPHDSSNYNSRNRPGASLGLDIDMPQFSEIPAKSRSYLRKKSPLESHYFPENERNRESLTPTLPTPTWGYSPGSTRALLGQNSSGESGEVYQAKTNPTTSTAHQHHVLPLAVTTPERAKRNATPRSPKGARAFTIVTEEDGKQPALTRNRVSQTSSYPSQPDPPYQQTPQRLRAPRSPKGARRMMITQPDSSKPNKTAPEPIEPPSNRSSFYSSSYQHSNPGERMPKGVLNYQRQSSASVSSSKTPDGRRRNVPRHQVLQKSYSTRAAPPVRSPERQQSRGASGYMREGPSVQQRQYIQQQQQNRSRWDKWAAEQEEKRRQTNSDIKRQHSFTPSHGSGTQQSDISKYRSGSTKSYPTPQTQGFAISSQPTHKRQCSEDFDHLEPMVVTDSTSNPSSQHENMTDGTSSLHESATVAPQGYPRAPQGARGNGPRMGWSPSRTDRISLSPQRSIHSVPGVALLHQGNTSLSASCRLPPTPKTRVQGQGGSFKMSQHYPGGSINKFYVPTSSTHQSVV